MMFGGKGKENMKGGMSGMKDGGEVLIELECPVCEGRLNLNNIVHADMFNKHWFDSDIWLSCASCGQLVYVNVSYDAQERKLSVRWKKVLSREE